MIINYFEDTGNLLYLYFVGLLHISHTHISKYRNKLDQAVLGRQT